MNIDGCLIRVGDGVFLERRVGEPGRVDEPGGGVSPVEVLGGCGFG